MGENTNGNNETNTENQGGNNNTENNNQPGNNTENNNSVNTENNTSQGQSNTTDTNSVKEQVAQIATQARTELFKLLGIKDTQTIRAIKAFMDTQKNDNNSGNNTANNEVEKRAIEAETKVDLMKNGVQPQYVDDAVIIVMSKTQGKKDADIKNAVSELKNKYPNWFDVKTDDENNAGKKGTGNVYNPAKNKEKDSGSLGQRLAAQRKGNKPAKSFWS